MVIFTSQEPIEELIASGWIPCPEPCFTGMGPHFH